MADSQTQQPVDTTQQATSKTPTTRPKNPKRVAEITKQTREVQKKALAEANIIIANNQHKQAALPVVDKPLDGTLLESESTKNVLTTT